jgi:endonuclease/exonuclease/phosphatase family metal-dependent hydrolase
MFCVVAATGQVAAAAARMADAATRVSGACQTARPSVLGPMLRVATLNVAHGRHDGRNQMLQKGSTIEANLREVAALLEIVEADVVALQEADGPSRWSGRFDHVEYLTRASGHACFVHGYHAESWLYRFGTALASDVMLSNPVVHSFAPTPPTIRKGFVLATIRWRPRHDPHKDGSAPISVRLVSVHLDFSRAKVRDAQIAEMVARLSGDSQYTSPLIVMGDFNADWFAKRSSVRQLAEQLDLRVFEPLDENSTTYRGNTRLDWILLSRSLDFARHQVVQDVVSDHRMVVADVVLAGGG